MSSFKPHLATDLDEAKVKFPTIAMPKIDGCRGLNIEDKFVGRSLKRFDNPFLATRFDGEDFRGFDGELAFGDWCSPSLCRDTTGFVNRQTPKPGKPVEGDIHWWIFDCLHESFIDCTYIERLHAASAQVAELQLNKGYSFLRMVPYEIVNSLEEVNQLEAKWLEMGFEGVILRNPEGMHKNGRATTKLGAYLRIKRFVDAEAKVTAIIEAMENTNEAKTNELGRSERSSHKENMVPKGMVGALTCEYQGEEITVGPGEMSHEDRIFYFNNPSLIVGEHITFKSFMHGKKDKPRFPTYKNIRTRSDMSEG